MSLVEKAKKIRTKNKRFNLGPEEISLALAWVEDEVNLPQINQALGWDIYSSKVYTFLAKALKASMKESAKQ